MKTVRTILAGLVLGATLHAQKKDAPEGKPPDPFAPAHKAFGWNSKNGLRFVWWLPKDYDPKTPRNLTVILHGTGLDYRWGYWNNKPGIFRPHDVVVSVDGPTPDGESRLFLGEPKDAKAVREFLREMRERFAIDRVFLYGHSQGGFFTVYFAGEYPDEVAGVVAHASGAWNWSKMGKGVHKVAIAFLHGTLDPVVPYRQSPGSRDAYAKADFPLLHLRRLSRYNHWPNAVRATETLDWCQGMTASDPGEAYACALRILAPKPSDEYQWKTAVGFSAAADVLRRLIGAGPAPLAGVPEDVAAAARERLAEIDAAGAEHVAALAKALPPKKPAASLAPGPWLGHLVPLREDFRGVASVETYVAALGYDDLAEAHAKAARRILDDWYAEKEPAEVYESIVETLPRAFLYEGLPPELAEKMNEWKRGARDLGISAKLAKKHAAFEAWSEAWKDGLASYESVWKKWKGPKGR